MPVFIHCWEEGIKLLTIENCPECNGYYGVNRSERRFQPDNQGLFINEPIRGRASVHDLVKDLLKHEDHSMPPINSAQRRRDCMCETR